MKERSIWAILEASVQMAGLLLPISWRIGSGSRQVRLNGASVTGLVSLAALYRLAADAARVGLKIAIEDLASRAASEALAGVQSGIAVEA